MKSVGPTPVRYDTVRQALTPARSRVLESLQKSEEPVTASGMATSLGLHANTAREHLEALVERGLATRSQAVVRGRGRPALRYAPSAELREPDTRVREYATLAMVLAEQISRSSHPQTGAIAAGRTWGHLLTKSVTRSGRASAQRRTVRLLADIGFDPVDDAIEHSVVLRRCPFLDVARQQSQIVCSAHLGMISAAVDDFGGNGDAVQLFPFGEPGGCIVTFGPSARAS
ncbi:unannotated protein [freshwater metagenome]|uniref:Unannotated protein n=1 Tax=freshwater metagenome TaxID=449393 RepID=A0A6J7FD40_9ZZZZ